MTMTRCERRRMKRLATLFWAVLSAITITAGALAMGLQDPPMQLREELIRPTPSPVPIPSPELTVWTRYDVPLEDELQRYIGEVCREYGVDTALVIAVIERESSFQPDKLGDGGQSYGLMQIYASQHTERCAELGAVNLMDPRQNIRAGVDFLAELLAEGNGTAWALSWYNGGGGKLPWPYAEEVMARAEILAESAMIVTE